MTKKKIGIFSPYFDTLGGGERYMLSIAECLMVDYDLELFWKDDSIIRKSEEIFNIRLNEVKINPEMYSLFSKSKKIIRKLIKTKVYHSIFYLSDGSIPFLFAKKNIVHFQAPFTNVNGKSAANRLKLKLINKIICNSSFTKRHIDKEFDVNSKVIYPPVNIKEFKSGKKENLILSVGRFDNLLQNKRQEVLIRVFKNAFKELKRSGFANWKMEIIGGLKSREGKLVVDGLNKLIAGFNLRKYINISINVDFNYLKERYAKAKLYWHAAGYGNDLKAHPEKAEHFGISTVEAMASGCVPLVINAGGQLEIIDDKKDGFLWDNEVDLKELTLKLAKNDKLRGKIAEAAINKSKKFSKDEFCRQIFSLLNNG